jgi:hypothetical protein
VSRDVTAKHHKTAKSLRFLPFPDPAMPRVSRREIFSETDVQVFHLISRCVRRNHLCGSDKRSGRDYSHRKQWIRHRLELLAGIFAVEILSYALMDNHLHLVVRTRPDLAAGWSPDQLAARWWALFPQRRCSDGSPAEATSHELVSSDTAIADKRRRLANVSWFMKCLAEPIAKRANREDGLTGHFWEARFKALPLLDELAIAACMTYVDLNPVRASLANSPENSNFTSVQDRITDRQSAQTATSADVQDQQTEHGQQAGWLAPVALEPPRIRVRDRRTNRRASNRGCLPMTLDQYLSLVDWSGRQVRPGKSGRIPADLSPILQRLDCGHVFWVELVRNFRRRFRRAAGRPETLLTVKLRRPSTQQIQPPPKTRRPS